MAKTSETRPEDEESPAARFQFVSKDLRLELSGTPEYVDAQVEFFKPALRRALGMPEPGPASAAAPSRSASCSSSTTSRR